ncbi:MAG: glycosyltransferase, partial [Kordiimonadaceae bacterium]|nr:glycosyltransferase [Kordiimonadaceae bacterium]
MPTPDFSIIITTRNRPVMFEAALKSVLSQQDVSLEVVVVNDGSACLLYTSDAADEA